MQSNAYHDVIEQLTASLQADDRVQGLVLLGSTANQSHPPDQWSDHDFFVITNSGDQEHFRTSFDWLPDHEAIVLTVRETVHGLKVLYDSGHLLEYAVFDLDEIAHAKANDYHVAFDRNGVTDAMRAIVTPPDSGSDSRDRLRRDMRLFLCLLVVGVGRVRRGEAISGQVFIRAHAVGHLLAAIASALDGVERQRLDNLDPLRRFEQVFPQLGAEINAILARPAIDAAPRLLDVYERTFREHDSYSAKAVDTVRRFLG